MRDELPRRGTVTEAIYDAGFNSNGRFYSKSTDVLGMTPARFRTGGEGESIRFAVGEWSLGSILVAATGKGICRSRICVMRTSAQRGVALGESAMAESMGVASAAADR